MTADGFTQLIDDSNAFFAELKQNNSKDWFNPRKDQYNETIKKPATFMADLLAEDFSRLSGRNYVPKLFRIYRDVRFSKDKTPLNAHLHILWRQPGNDPFAPMFFFESEPGDMSVGCGIGGLKGESLTRFRAFVDDHGDTLSDAIEQTGMGFSSWGSPPLKRVPKPYDQDHPHAELLKRKNLILSAKMDDSWRNDAGGLLRAITRRFETALPVMQLLEQDLR